MARTVFVPTQEKNVNMANIVNSLNKFLNDKVFVNVVRVPKGLLIFYELYEQNVLDKVHKDEK